MEIPLEYQTRVILNVMKNHDLYYLHYYFLCPCCAPSYHAVPQVVSLEPVTH